MKRESGKFVIRMDPQLHRRLKGLGTKQGKSLNEICLQLLDQGPFQGQPLQEQLSFLKDSLVSLVLFGSAARGEEKSTSDQDLLIVMEEEIPITPALYKKWDEIVGPNVSANLSPHFAHFPKDLKNPGSLWLEIAIDGKILWDKNFRVHQTLRQIRETIAEGIWKRKLSHGQPYWVFEQSKVS